MQVTLHTKLPQVGTTIFSVMSALAAQYEAINLSQGFPNFPCDAYLLELLTKYAHSGHNQYAHTFGVPALRQAIAQMVATQYAATYNPDTEITITSGATEALYAAITAIVRPQDEVIVLEPCYDSYVPAIELNGGKPVFVALQAPDFSPNWGQIRAAVSPKTRAIILNTPHNPTGYVWTQADMDELTALVADTQIIIISDEVYEFMSFDQKPHLSVNRYEALRQRAFIVSSFGKTFHTTGWKVGYCLAPEAFSTEFRKTHQYLTFSTHTPTQYAIAEYMQEPTRYTQLAHFYQQKRDKFVGLLQGSAFGIVPTQGTYFQLLNYEKISQETDTALAERLVKEIGVAAIPVSVFYHNKRQDKVLRFCFAKDDQTLEQAAERLRQLSQRF